MLNLQQIQDRDDTVHGTQAESGSDVDLAQIVGNRRSPFDFRSFFSLGCYVSFLYVCRCAHGTKVVENQIVFGTDPSESPEVARLDRLVGVAALGPA